VKKIFLEIIKLLWKLVKLVFWKWLRPMLVPILFFAAVIVVIVIVVAFLAFGAC
jgi:hypothetical protein